jgi:protease I
MSFEDRAVVVLAAQDYQELELWYPVLRARELGLAVAISCSDPAGITSRLGYPLVGTELDGRDYDAVVVAGTVSGEPALADDQLALIRTAAAGGTTILSVGTANQVVIDLAGADRVTTFAATDDLPELMTTLAARLSG